MSPFYASPVDDTARDMPCGRRFLLDSFSSHCFSAQQNAFFSRLVVMNILWDDLIMTFFVFSSFILFICLVAHRFSVTLDRLWISATFELSMCFCTFHCDLVGLAHACSRFRFFMDTYLPLSFLSGAPACCCISTSLFIVMYAMKWIPKDVITLLL
jgi:hypothetical protein